MVRIEDINSYLIKYYSREFKDKTIIIDLYKEITKVVFESDSLKSGIIKTVDMPFGIVDAMN